MITDIDKARRTKRLASRWATFTMVGIDSSQQPTRRQIKRAYYAGAEAVFKMLTNPEFDDSARSELLREMQEFAKAIQEGRA